MGFLPKKILSSSDLKLLRGVGGNTFQKRLSYQLKTGKLLKLRKGIYLVSQISYALTKEDFLVLANMVYTPSYISLETVLLQSGAIFQYYDTIFLAGPYKKIVHISLNEYQLSFSYLAIPKELLTYTGGLIHKNGYTIAGFERAFCDILWRNPDYYFDILSADMFDNEVLGMVLDVYSLFKPNIKQRVLSTLERYGIDMAIPA